MITKKQWKEIIRLIDMHIIDYDFYIHDFRVIKVSDDKLSIFAQMTNDRSIPLQEYKHPQSFMTRKPTMSHIMQCIKMRPKPPTTSPPNLKAFVDKYHDFS